MWITLSSSNLAIILAVFEEIGKHDASDPSERPEVKVLPLAIREMQRPISLLSSLALLESYFPNNRAICVLTQSQYWNNHTLVLSVVFTWGP